VGSLTLVSSASAKISRSRFFLRHSLDFLGINSILYSEVLLLAELEAALSDFSFLSDRWAEIVSLIMPSTLLKISVLVIAYKD